MRPPRRLAPDHAYVWRQLEQGLSARGLLKGHVVLGGHRVTRRRVGQTLAFARSRWSAVRRLGSLTLRRRATDEAPSEFARGSDGRLASSPSCSAFCHASVWLRLRLTRAAMIPRSPNSFHLTRQRLRPRSEPRSPRRVAHDKSQEGWLRRSAALSRAAANLSETATTGSSWCARTNDILISRRGSAMSRPSVFLDSSA
jgi:hypothetical protein